jgi:hypothetical protein
MFLVVEDCEVYPVNWWNRHSHWSRASKLPQQESSQVDFGLRLRLMTDKIRQRFISKDIAFLDAALSVPGCIGGRRQHLHHAIQYRSTTSSSPLHGPWCDDVLLSWTAFGAMQSCNEVIITHLVHVETFLDEICQFFHSWSQQKSRRSQHRRVSATLINWVKTLWRKRLRFSSFKAPTLTACQCESEIMELHRTWVNQA